VRILSVALASYHVNFLLTKCREHGIAIVFHEFAKGSRGSNPRLKPYMGNSSGITVHEFSIRASRAVEFMLIFGGFVHEVRQFSGDIEDPRRTQHNRPFEKPPVDIEEMRPFKEVYRQHWGY
jgi:hypothetical protein